METIEESERLNYSSKKAFRIVLIYLTVSVIWIIGFDIFLIKYLLGKTLPDVASIIISLLFLIFTSILIYFLVRSTINTIQLESGHAGANDVKLKYLFDWASDGIFVSDNSGRYIDVNQKGCQILGYSREEILTKHVSDLVIFDNESMSLHLDKLGSGETIISERRLKKKNGSFIITEISSRMLPDKNYQAIVRDITERKTIEEELKSKTEEMNIYFNRSMDLLSISDTDGYFYRLNPAWEKTLGYSIPELEGKRFLDFVHPDDIDSTLSAMSSLNDDKNVLSFVNRYRDKKGSYHWLEWDSSPFGKYVYAVARDITDRKLAEEKLKDQEQLLIETGRIAKVGGWEFDVGSLKGTWTPEVARIHDLDPEKETNAEIGMSFYHGENRTKIENAIRDAIELRKSYDLELELISAKGTHKWVRTIGYPVIERDKVVKLRGSFQDITKRKQTENALRESEERYRKLVDITPDAIAIHSEGKVVFVNNSAIKLMKAKTESDLLEKPIEEIVHPDNWQTSRERILKMLNGETGLYPVEDKYIRLDGIAIAVDVNAIPLVYKKKPAVLITARDITERKKVETELLKSRERYRSLSSHLQTVREEERASIAREMHDELGQILTSLKMNLSLLRRQIEDNTKNITPQQIVEELNSTNKMIDKAVKRVRKLITQLRPELLDKLGLLSALEWYIQEFSKNTKIKCDFLCTTDELILGTEAELAVFRIIQEALTNTAKHSGADIVTVSILKNEHEIIFEIKDNGRGISEEELKGEKSFGLLGMRERAELIGANLEISRGLQKGTIIKLQINN